ncbi:MAG TPA: hypothetical protein VF452_09690 [Candidatus Binatia bacterium]
MLFGKETEEYVSYVVRLTSSDFDHDLPWSKGSTSVTEENVQLLCGAP